MREYRTVRVADINTGDRFLDPADLELADLVEEIQTEGLLTPILVDSQLNLIDGLRRLEAYKPDDDVDVVISLDYIETLELMIRDRNNPRTRPWTPRRVWDFHYAATEQRKAHQHAVVTSSLPRNKSKNKTRTPDSIFKFIGKSKRNSLSREVLEKLSGYSVSALQTLIMLYSKVAGVTPEPNPRLLDLAGDLVKAMDAGYNVYSAKTAYHKAQRENLLNVTSEREQRQILRNAAASTTTTAGIVTQVADISDGITTEEAQAWLATFTQARADYWQIIKKLKERIARG